MKKFKAVASPTDELVAFGKAFNQICADNKLKAVENTWTKFINRELSKDKIIMMKLVAAKTKKSETIITSVVNILKDKSIDKASKACPAIMPFSKCVIAWLEH